MDITTETNTINSNWTDNDGNHQGGQSCGIGFTIAWQRGGLNTTDRNGAFIIDVLDVCLNQLNYFQNSKFATTENAEAINNLQKTIDVLIARRDRRKAEGTLGTHELDKH